VRTVLGALVWGGPLPPPPLYGPAGIRLKAVIEEHRWRLARGQLVRLPLKGLFTSKVGFEGLGQGCPGFRV
jgi:hypothetical protein